MSIFFFLILLLNVEKLLNLFLFLINSGYPKIQFLVPDPSLDNTDEALKLTWKHKIVKECQALKGNLDVPMNRFLIFSGYYFFFTLTVLNLMSGSSEKSDFWIYTCAIYTVSMIWHDIQAISTLKSVKTFFKFWRVFDLIMHIFFIMAIIGKLIFKHDDFRD